MIEGEREEGEQAMRQEADGRHLRLFSGASGRAAVGILFLLHMDYTTRSI